MLNINTPAQAKKSARALEKALENNGISLQYGKALDIISNLCGCQDWNALAASLASLPANNLPSKNGASLPALPTIQEVCFEDISAVCIQGGSGYRVNCIADNMIKLLAEVGSPNFEANADEPALYLQKDDDELPFDDSLTLGQLASLTWNADKKMFEDPEGTSYEFFFPVTTSQWFEQILNSAPTAKNQLPV